jgi:hypothetical protein
VWIMPRFHCLHEHLFLGLRGIVRIINARKPNPATGRVSGTA